MRGANNKKICVYVVELGLYCGEESDKVWTSILPMALGVLDVADDYASQCTKTIDNKAPLISPHTKNGF